MLIVDIQQDALLQENLNKVLSGLLPHKNYNPDLFQDLLRVVTTLIEPEEMYGEYYTLVETLMKIRDIKQSIKSYKPKLTKDTLTATLISNVPDLVRNEHVQITKILEMEGHETNIEIERNFDNACNLLYSRTLELYEDCMALEITSEEAVTYVSSLKSAFITHTAQESLKVQAQILKSSVKIGRKVLAGPQDWLEYVSNIHHIINNRLQDEDERVLKLDSMEKSDELMERLHATHIPLANYGIPVLDDQTPMLRHRLVVVSAKENTGKTMLAVNWAINLIKNRRKVLFMCGENNFEKIQPLFISNYIYQKYGMHITPSDITNMNDLPPDICRLINIARAELMETGCIKLIKYFDYYTLYEELVAEYDKEAFDALIIDHTYALRGGGSEYERIGALARAMRQFKNDYPVFNLVLSHLSTDAKEAIIKGKRVEASPTKGNGSLAAEADEILILSDNELLAKQGLLQVQNYKRRGAEKVEDYIILKKKFNVASFIYDEKLQNSADASELGLAELESVYDDIDDDDDYEDEDYGDL